ncbi:DUF4240 domain-containing protein [Kitasatospora sp. NPDC017646]|uniref:DUF4240 domain-containing protein n=1 Tax=Kitasatospora sp. NPDC017646 TaxID=3364024 RepID=UPI0037A3E5CE
MPRWDVWAAAHLIGGGCSDDSFVGFRAGLIAFGRDWYERAADAPESLAEHPSVQAGAADGGQWLGRRPGRRPGQRFSRVRRSMMR